MATLNAKYTLADRINGKLDGMMKTFMTRLGTDEDISATTMSEVEKVTKNVIASVDVAGYSPKEVEVYQGKLRKFTIDPVKLGIKKINFFKNKPWLPNNLSSPNLISFHQDQVVKLPKEAELLASNSFCSISSFSIGDSVLTLQAHPEFNHDFSMKLLKARKSNIELLTYLEAVNELKTLDHDGELITPNIIKFLEQKC